MIKNNKISKFILVVAMTGTISAADFKNGDMSGIENGVQEQIRTKYQPSKIEKDALKKEPRIIEFVSIGAEPRKRVDIINGSYVSSQQKQFRKDLKRQSLEKKKRLNKLRRSKNVNNLKLMYLSKLNQIEQCVLLVNTREDFDLCNRRVDNLSKSLNRINRQGKKSRMRNNR